LKLHLNQHTDRNIFTAHGAGYVMVNGQRHEQSIVVTPDELLTGRLPATFDALQAAHFDALLELQPEVVLFGSGSQLRFPHPRLYQALSKARIGVECMDTPAACRTYNILMSEDRKVVAMILL
jgi:uncharacterized protein